MDSRTLLDLDFGRIVDSAARMTQTSRGRALVRGIQPFRTPAECEAELVLVEEATALLAFPDFPGLDGVEDISAQVEVARKGGVLSAHELIACARLLRAGSDIQKALKDYRLRAPVLAEQVGRVPGLLAVAERIELTFDEEHRIRDDASPRLAELRQQASYLGRRVKVLIEQMLADSQVQTVIQDNYYTIREGRYVLPVKAEDRRFMPGIIHGTSQTGATVFIEPESVVNENNQLKVVLDQVEVEEYAILTDRTRLLGRFAGDAIAISEALWRMDSLLAKGRLAMAMNAGKPATGGPVDGLKLLDARNPILLLLGRDVVPVTVTIPPPGGESGVKGGEGRCMVVSGPNAGGKSVTLSTVGLCCVMTRFGLLPPLGSGSVVPWYDQVFTVVGDPTSMDRAVSTFTGQIVRVMEALNRGPGRTLALLDELATGTEPRRGEALAAAVVEAMVDGGAECLVATHFDALKDLGLRDRRFTNARVGVNPKTRLPNFLLETGVAGESNPFEVAASVGLPPSILERARAAVGERERRLEEALAEAERLKADMTRERAEAEELKRRLSVDKKTYEAELTRLRRDSDRLVYEARREVLEKMKRLEEELDRIAREAREAKAKATIVLKRTDVRERKAEVRRDIDREAPLVEDCPADPMPADELKPGTTVYVFPLRAEGKLIEVAQDGKRATVQVGAMKTAVKVADLRKPKPKKTLPGKAFQKPAPVVKAPPLDEREPRTSILPTPAEPAPWIRTATNTVDCRGMRVDEAMAEVDKFLDGAFGREEERVLIIHGLGTSALRNAIRKYLDDCKYCRRFRPGEREEGGEGVTVVEMS